MITAQTLQKEEVLVIIYQATGCSKAFGELYNIFYSQLFDYVCKITKNADDAFDITQEVFIKAVSELPKLKVPITFRFWLFRIAKHMCMKHLKAQNKIVLDSYEEDFIVQDYSLEEAINKEEMLVKMANVIDTLTLEEQDLLKAKYSQGKSIKEIMECTQLGSSAVKMKLMRARQKVEVNMNLARL